MGTGTINNILADLIYIDPSVVILTGGSSVIPYINNPGDKDIIIVSPTHYADYRSYLFRSRLFIQYKQQGIDLCVAKHQNIDENPVSNYFAQPIYGNVDKFNLFDKTNIIQTINYWLPILEASTANDKKIYQIVAALYMYKHNSSQLSTEEIATIQRWHDKQATVNDYWMLWIDFWTQMKKLEMTIDWIHAPDIKRFLILYDNRFHDRCATEADIEKLQLELTQVMEEGYE